MRTRALLAGALALLLALPVFGAARHDEPVPAFAPVDIPAMASTPGRSSPTRAGGPHRGNGADDRGQGGVVPPVDVRHLAAAHDEAARAQPTPHLIVIPRGSPQPASHRASGTATGRASWYDDGPGLYAAAGPSLRSGHWRGRRVVVCADAQCVRVVLSDWCQCYFRTDRERVIDLSPAAFSWLAPLSRGLVKVTVSW